MKNPAMRKAYSFLFALMFLLGVLLSPFVPARVAFAASLDLNVGQVTQLLTTIPGASWSSDNDDVVEVDKLGNVVARGVGITSIKAIARGQVQDREIVVRAPQSAPVFSTRQLLRDALLKAAMGGKARMTFRVSMPALPEDSDAAQSKIMAFFPTSDEFFAAYCRELHFNFIWMTNGSQSLVEATCTFDYASAAKVAAVYRGESEILAGEAKALKQKCDEIIASLGLKTMKTKYEKVLAVHDYIVQNAYYDKAAVDNADFIPESFTAYGVLIEGKGVCQSYAEAMKLLLNATGVNCDYVVGESNENHVWNRVQLDDGNWYNVDATWDDPSPDRGSRVSHVYFCVTDEELQLTHSWTDYSHRCNSTTYSYENIMAALGRK